MNNSEALTTLIVGGRTAKEYSQRELARRIGISNSSLNDIENGRVAKPDPEILKRIAEELELSLQQLLKAAGYNEVMSWFSHDEFKNKSTKDLKNTIEECRLFKYDILDSKNRLPLSYLVMGVDIDKIRVSNVLIPEDIKSTDSNLNKMMEYFNGKKNCNDDADIKTKLKFDNEIDKKYVDNDIYEIGLTEIETPMGNKVKVYDIERCICDIIRSKNRMDFEHIKHSVREYIKRKDKDLVKLSLYAEKLGIKEVVMDYIGMMYE